LEENAVMHDGDRQHPAADQLSAFLQGRVEVAELDSIQEHLEGCDTCRAALDSANEDDFVARLRKLAGEATEGSQRVSLPPHPGPANARDLRTNTLSTKPAPGEGTGTHHPPCVSGYEVLEKVGHGGAGVVYKARQVSLGRVVALKMILAGSHASPSARERFLMEATAVARLQHPNIVHIYEVGEADGHPYFSMEFVDGGSLAQALQGMPQAPGEAARLVQCLAEAMHCAHQRGIIHRDLKPANILLQRGEGPAARGEESSLSSLAARPSPLAAVPKISDFGLAKQLDDPSGRTETGSILGTASYMAPEQAAGRVHDIGPAADTYALGAVLYELLTGRPPFRGATMLDTLEQVRSQEPVPPSRLQPALPHDLETICLKCLEKDPERRYASGADLAADLGRFLAHEPIQARRVGRLERAWKWTRRNPLVAGLLAAVGLLLVVGTAVSVYFAIEARGQERKARAAQAVAEGKAKDARTAEAFARGKAAEARLAEAKANRHLARAHLDHGLALCEQGEAARGIHWLLESLKTAPGDDADFRRLVRLNLAAWMDAVPALRHVIRHEGLRQAACSPDGKVVATLGKDRAVRLWNVASGAMLRVLNSSETPTSVCFSPDSKTIAIGGAGDPGQSSRVSLWNAATGGLQATLQAPGRVNAVPFTLDGRKLVTGADLEGDHGEVRVWDAHTHKPAGLPLPQLGGVEALYLSPDGRFCLAKCGVAWGSIWQASDLVTGRHLRDGWGLGIAAEGVLLPGSHTFLHHEATDAVGSLTLQWRDVVTDQLRRAVPRIGGAGVVAIRSASPDGRTCWFSSSIGRINGRDAATGRLLISWPAQEGFAEPAAVSGNGKFLVVLSRSPTARVWELPSMWIPPAEAVAVEPEPSAGPRRPAPGFQNIAFSPDRTRVLLGGWGVGDAGQGGMARLINLASGHPVGSPLRHPWDNVRCVAFSPDGKVMATGAHPAAVGGGVWLWDAHTGLPLRPPLLLTNYPSALAFSPDGKLLATGDYHQAVRLWDVATGTPVGQPLMHAEVILSLAFSPDGKTLAAGTADDRSGAPQVRLWDVASGQPLGSGLRHSYRVSVVTFSPDGRTLLSGGLDGTVRRWDVETRQLLGELPPQLLGSFTPNAFPQGIPFSPNGRTFLTGNGDGLVRLWETATGRPLRGATLQHQGSISAGAYSPDGKLVVVGCKDGIVRLWDCATFRPIGPPGQLRHAILDVAFTPDSRFFIAVDRSGRTRRWPVPLAVADVPDRLALWLQVRTGLQMDDNQEVALLALEQWDARRRELVRLEGTAKRAWRFSVRDADWHEGCAADAEQGRNGVAALWHLERLIVLRPADWVLHARKAHAHLGAGRAAEAVAAAAQAKERATAEEILHWDQHRALDCLLTGQWSPALWYLDRVQAAVPDDWQTYADRAEVLGKLGKAAERGADFARAIRHGAPQPLVIHVADEHGRRGQWQQAAEYYVHAAKQGPLPLDAWHHRALAHLYNNDQTGYREMCELLVRSAGRTPPPPAAHAIARICVLGPKAVEDYHPVAVLVEGALAQAGSDTRTRRELLITLGTVLCRAGRHREALAHYKKGLEGEKGNGAVRELLFVALAHHGLAEPAAARAWLGKVQPRPAPLVGARSWEELETELLRREVEALVLRKGHGG
jgi:WD40 repeat protein